MAAPARRLVSIFTAAAVAIALLAPAASAASPEGEILSLMNAARANSGLAPVSMHLDLTDDALAWSRHMEGEGSLSHNPNLSSVAANWDKLGENVGVGTSPQALHDAFMASSSHRGNILGDYDYVGIAVVEETPTKLWVTVVFMKSLDGAAVEASTDDAPNPYAKEQPQPTTEQPEPAAQDTQAPATESTEPASDPAAEIVPYDSTATLVFLG